MSAVGGFLWANPAQGSPNEAPDKRTNGVQRGANVRRRIGRVVASQSDAVLREGLRETLEMICGSLLGPCFCEKPHERRIYEYLLAAHGALFKEPYGDELAQVNGG